MNPHIRPSISPWALLSTLWTQRALVFTLTQREVLGRYKGSLFGIAWTLLTPLLMLAVFTFVFGDIFKARWAGSDGGGRLDFAVALFVGLLTYNFLAECLSKAPTVILSNPNYVKKVIFPLDVLAPVTVAAALFHLLTSLVILLLLAGFSAWPMGWTGLYAPLILLPYVLLVLGLTWLLGGLGVYLRDVTQIITPALTGMLFLSPVFYPLSSVPTGMTWLFLLNPVTFIVESLRGAILQGQTPSITGWLTYMAISTAIAWIGFVFFQKTRQGFADVL